MNGDKIQELEIIMEKPYLHGFEISIKSYYDRLVLFSFYVLLVLFKSLFRYNQENVIKFH